MENPDAVGGLQIGKLSDIYRSGYLKRSAEAENKHSCIKWVTYAENIESEGTVKHSHNNEVFPLSTSLFHSYFP